MTTKPENLSRYPSNWAQIRKSIQSRAGNKCEHCGAANRQENPETGSRVVCCVAHLDDENPENCDPSNLAFLCQACHNRYDKDRRALNRGDSLKSDGLWAGPSSLEALLVDIADLKEDPENARKHGARSIRSISASLKRFGQRKPVVVNRQTGKVEAGNGMLLSARHLGWSRLAAVYVDDGADAARQFALYDNRTSELSDWDSRILHEQLRGLDDVDSELWTQGEIGKELDRAPLDDDKTTFKEWDASALEVKACFMVTVPIERQAELRLLLEQFKGLSFAESTIDDA